MLFHKKGLYLFSRGGKMTVVKPFFRVTYSNIIVTSNRTARMHNYIDVNYAKSFIRFAPKENGGKKYRNE